jgi:hypothetical protein
MSKSDHTTFVHHTGSAVYGSAAILAACTGRRPVPPGLAVRHCTNLMWFDLAIAACRESAAIAATLGASGGGGSFALSAPSRK